MKRASMMILALVFASAGRTYAQSNPISAGLKADWADVSVLLAKEADKMPDEDYRFKPTPEIQDFGQRMAHIISFNLRVCSTLAGHPKTANVSQNGMPTKADIVAAMKEANDTCDAFFGSLTDADLNKMVSMGTGPQRLEVVVINDFILQHSQEMYGYMAVYLRLKGVVPPSSDHTDAH
jgi:hypothetical protein